MTEKIVLQGMDVDDLYRAETYTDRKAATIQVLVPVDAHGSRDPKRRQLFQSVVGMQWGGQTQHIEFLIEDAVTLKDAVEMWDLAATAAMEKAVADAEKRAFESRMVIGSSLAAGRVN
jgi:hypothetical protein